MEICRRNCPVRYDTSSKKYETIGFDSSIENDVVRVCHGKILTGTVITPLHITISDDATNEPLGLTQYINSKIGQPVPLMSVITSMPVSNSNEKLFLKWKAGEPFVFTRHSAITNKPINRGGFFYSFTFTAPNGDGGFSSPGAIVVRDGKILRLTTEEFIELLKAAAEKAK